jgi:hypothetical protein
VKIRQDYDGCSMDWIPDFHLIAARIDPFDHINGYFSGSSHRFQLPWVLPLVLVIHLIYNIYTEEPPRFPVPYTSI